MFRVVVSSIMILALLSATSASAGKLQDLPVVRKFPQKRELIETYTERYRRSRTVSGESGASIAAGMLLAEAEDDLLDAGLSREEIGTLATHVDESIERERLAVRQAEDQSLVERDPLKDLGANLETLSLEEISQRMDGVLASRPQYREVYERVLRANAEIRIYPYENEFVETLLRLGTGFLVLQILQKEGVNLKKEIRVLDSYLHLLERYLVGLTKRTYYTRGIPEHLIPMDYWSGGKLKSILIDRWKFLHRGQKTQRDYAAAAREAGRIWWWLFSTNKSNGGASPWLSFVPTIVAGISTIQMINAPETLTQIQIESRILLDVLVYGLWGLVYVRHFIGALDRPAGSGDQIARQGQEFIGWCSRLSSSRERAPRFWPGPDLSW